MPSRSGAPVTRRHIPASPLVSGTTTRESPQFWLSATREFGRLTLWLHGDLDLAAHHELVAGACAHLSSGRTSAVTVDLGGLDFLGVSGISTLVAVQRLAEQRGIPFALRNVPVRVARVFGICGVTRGFHSQRGWVRAPQVGRSADAS
jgi:anti-anti-sigma factor